jgi:hypothetical protein
VGQEEDKKLKAVFEGGKVLEDTGKEKGKSWG